MVTEADALPRWDLESVFPSVNSPEFAGAVQDATQAVDTLATLFDTHGVDQRSPAPLDDDTVRAVEGVIGRYNEVLAATRRLEGYLVCLVEADTRDEQV